MFSRVRSESEHPRKKNAPLCVKSSKKNTTPPEFLGLKHFDASVKGNAERAVSLTRASVTYPSLECSTVSRTWNLLALHPYPLLPSLPGLPRCPENNREKTHKCTTWWTPKTLYRKCYVIIIMITRHSCGLFSVTPWALCVTRNRTWYSVNIISPFVRPCHATREMRVEHHAKKLGEEKKNNMLVVTLIFKALCK